MDLSAKLKEKGWYLTDAGLAKLQSLAVPGTENVQKFIDIAMNLDIREIGGGAIALKRSGKLTSNIVLQLLKLRNISAPKANEESKVAPRTLQIELSDGQQTIYALEIENDCALSLSIPPGTKLLFKQSHFNMLGAFVKLLRNDLQVLGGQVPALVEKWELARSMHQFSRDGNRLASEAGPPAWVAFGKKSNTSALPAHNNFKSLAAAQTVKKNENESFNAFRSEAIAEATKQGAKKVFSAGQQLVDSNMKKIIDKGYTEEEAKRALAHTTNNLERAFSYLKRLKSGQTANPSNYDKQRQTAAGNNYNNRNNSEAINSKEVVSKPSGNVMLSEFLADKLVTPRQSETTEKSDTSSITTTTTTTTTKTTQQNVNNKAANKQIIDEQRIILKNTGGNTKRPNDRTRRASSSATRAEQRKFENNMSSSFAETHRYKGSNGYNSRHNNNNNNRRGETENGANTTRTVYNNRGRRNGNDDRQQTSKSLRGKKPAISPTNHNNNNNNNNNKNFTNNNHVRNEQKNYYNQNKLENGDSKVSTGAYHNRATTSGGQQKHQQKSQTQNSTKTKNSAIDPYDASKIRGFQSKETNELALNLLKSEGVNFKSVKSSTLPDTAGAAATPAIKPFKSIHNDNSAPQQKQQPYKKEQKQSYKQEQQVAKATTTNHISKEEQLAAGFDYDINEPWNWRIGDLCMAKYWDDGCYYKAEITAISDKTFVVYFVGYGNHEEVLRTDCLPITDEEHRPINNYRDAANDERNRNPIQGAMEQLGTTSTHTTVRHRYERQVYVPPAKRSEI